MAAVAAAAPVALLLALTQGSVTIGWNELVAALGGKATTASTVILELRLPRALNAFAVGALLALSGSLLQVLLRNPLADPYILGVSGGASVAALAAMLVGGATITVGGAAFAGAVIAMLLVFTLARRGGGTWSANRLLLTGVVCAAGFGALVSLILAITPAGKLPGMLFWLLGDLSHGGNSGLAWAALALGLMIASLHGRALNVLARGEQVAAALGENTARLRWTVYFLTSALTATAVMVAGAIGFVGLVIPHLLRLLGLSDHRLLLPAACLLGGSFLTLADTLARTVAAPTQLPVGVITALIGVPVFLWLLSRDART
jgi:iron complex transport system permease protein